MQITDFTQLDLRRLPSPCFVVDEVAVEKNLHCLADVEKRSGAKILHALKAFSMHSLSHLSNKYLSGTCSSGLHEALLAKEFYDGEIHVFSAAYTEKDFIKLLEFANHIVFNSCSQLLRFEKLCREAIIYRPDMSFGLRINPQHSEGEVELYDPCAPGSRLGITLNTLNEHLQKDDFKQAFSLISGLHFHTLCEQGFLPLQRTLETVEQQFGHLLNNMQWLNLGGGHHITSPHYQTEALIKCIQTLSNHYQLQIYLEPGEAVAVGTGILSTEVLDIGFNELPQAILDTSATCHMPDTLEMPYRPDITGGAAPEKKPFTYRLGGLTCLAGDVIGDYSFDTPLNIGQRLIFEDMAHYTMVKTSTFNGTLLPALAIWNSETDKLQIVKTFSYDDFKHRLS